METLRDEVRFALTTQSGMEVPALDGEGHAIVSPTFFEGRVPEHWLSEDVFPKPVRYKACGFDGSDVYGIATLDVHDFVANKVAVADPNFQCPGFIGRGKQARAILNALHAWIGNA